MVFDANAPFALNGTFNTFNYDTHMTYVEQWNFSIQRQFGKDWLASVSYLGNEMVHLFGTRELNPGIFAPGSYPRQFELAPLVQYAQSYLGKELRIHGYLG